MRRGIFFAILLSTLAVASVLLAAERARAETTVIAQAGDDILARKLQLVFADISEDVVTSAALSTDADGDVLTAFDTLPASKQVDKGLKGYDRFVREYYQPADLEVKFLSSTGQEINLSTLTPGLLVQPFNQSYYYPDQGKRELSFNSTSASFGYIRGIFLNITLTDGWFNPMPAVTCSPWSPYFSCGSPCLLLKVEIRDKNGSFYNSTCTQFDVSKQSKLQISLANETDTDKWIRITAGDLPLVYKVELQKSSVTIQSSFVFNTSNYYTNTVGKLSVRDLASNASKLDDLATKIYGQSNASAIKAELGLT
jgi:hypothetical protein